MAEQNDDKDDDKTAGTELRESLGHLFSAFRKIAKAAEPAVHRSLDSAEAAVQSLGKGGESVAREMGKEVASAATRLAERLRALAEREERTSGDADRGESSETSETGEPPLRHEEPKSE